MRPLKLACAAALALVTVSAAALLFLLIVRGRSDENAVAALPPPALSTTGTVEAGPTVLLLRVEATARHFAAVPGAAADGYDRRVADWRQRLETAGARVRVLDESALIAALASDENARAHVVVVAPSAAALHDDTVAHIVAAVDAGAGLIATWAFGLYGAEGTWRGYAPLTTLVDAEPLGAAAAGGEAPRYIALHGQTSVTVGLPAGARLEIQPYDQPLPLVTKAAVGDFVDWAMLVRGSGEVASQQTAVARATHGRGRVVWMNFEPGAVVGGGPAANRVTRLVENALAWTGRVARGDLETWPGGARAAAAIGLDAEHEFEKGTAIAARLAASNVPFTTF
ncbi:MAG: hypothetical protein ABIR79_07335, partial [Candidatus Binatia bacterium]